MKCPQCSTINPRKARFCFHCGTNLLGEDELMAGNPKTDEDITKAEMLELMPSLSEETLLAHNPSSIPAPSGNKDEPIKTVLDELDKLSVSPSVKKKNSEDEGDLDADDSQGVVRTLLEVVGVIALIIFILVGGSLLYAVNKITDAPVAVIQHDLDLIKSGEIQAAYADTSYEFKRNTTYDVFQQFITQNPSISNNKEIQVSHRSVEKDHAFVDGNLVSTAGQKAAVKYILVKEGDSWKILNIDLGK